MKTKLFGGFVAALVVYALSGCGTNTGTCKTSADCGPGLRCDTVSALCVADTINAPDGGDGSSDPDAGEAADAGPGPSLQTRALPDAIVGNAYLEALAAEAEGGTSPLSWSLEGVPGSLSWLSIDSATGELRGTPTAVASASSFTVKITDAISRTASASYSLTVRACTDGEKVACTAAQSGACYLGEQTCENGTLGACTTSDPSSEVATCGASCGACDAKAADNCDSGVCACGSGAPCSGSNDSCCDGTCEDTQTDPDHCGDCATSCDSGRDHVVRTCNAGSCEYPCAPGYARCPAGSTAASCETDLQNDLQNCGACGKACPNNPPNTVSVGCSQGKCAVVQCASGYEDCNGIPEDGCEVYVAGDTDNCGACNKSCGQPSEAQGVACTNGVCTITSCQAGFSNCDTTFENGCEIDTTNDLNHCGACFTVCGAQQHSTGSTCADSKCELVQCSPGYDDCDNQFPTGCEKNISSDLQNCGVCGHICPTQLNTTGSTCNAGTCGFLGCNAGFASCNSPSIQDGCETSITTTSNCGGCGITCSGKPNATGYACANQLCAVTSCSPNFANCDGQYYNGCEANLTNDVQHCGACGTVCNLPHANNACVGASCAISSCQGTYRNCNTTLTDGCEADTTIDRNNCGSCGNICASNKICDSGHCVFPF